MCERERQIQHTHHKPHTHPLYNASQQSQEQSEEWYLSGWEETGKRSDNERLRERGRRSGETMERLGIHEGSLIEMREGGRER